MFATVWIAVAAQTAGTLIGIVLGPLLLAQRAALRLPAWTFSWLFRGTPLLVQILFFFAVIPQLGLRLGVIWTGLVALALNEGARMAEIVRAGLMSVPRGQTEAARALGLGELRIFLLVVLPQAARMIVPPLGNNFNYMLKATSLLSVIGISELLRTGQLLAQATTRPLEVYASIACCYLIVTTSWDIIQRRIEARVALPGTKRASGPASNAAISVAPIAADPPADAAASVIGIGKRFGGTTILEDVSIEVRRGEVLVIMGPSGSGKTTLLRCLNGLETPSSGAVFVAGERLSTEPRVLARQRRAIGFVFQRFNLFPHRTALENVALALRKVLGLTADEAARRARDLLAKVGLADKLDAYPAHLSGGQQQRVAIARALAMEPKLMLFDEPTSALDAETVREVLDVMRTLARAGMTMVIVTHEIGFAREVASRVVFMDHGRIVETGPAARFFAAPRTDRARAFLAQVAR